MAPAGLISKWIRDSAIEPSDSNDQEFLGLVAKLFGLFELLAIKGVYPFSTHVVGLIESFRNPNWTNLPQELSYLIAPATYYGRLGSENEVLAFIEGAKSKDIEILSEIAERIRINGHMQIINAFLDSYQFPKHEESTLLYSLLLLLDHAVGLP